MNWQIKLLKAIDLFFFENFLQSGSLSNVENTLKDPFSDSAVSGHGAIDSEIGGERNPTFEEASEDDGDRIKNTKSHNCFQSTLVLKTPIF